MKQLKKISIYVIGVFLLFNSCTKDFDTVNTNPASPKSTTIAPLVNGIESTLFLGWQEQASILNDWYYSSTQLAGETSLSGYLMVSGASEIWNGYYSALQNINQVQALINAATDKEAYNNIQAILNTLKAYKTFRVTDQFGDIPYSNAGKAFTGNIADNRPTYDKQQDIYKSLLEDLNWAVTNINTDASAKTAKGNPFADLGSYDVLFGNDMTKWKKWANSLLLRYSLQLAEKDPATATKYATIAFTANTFIDDGADVALWPAKLGGYDIQSRIWSFGSGGTGYVRISTTFWNLVADGTNPSQIFDPRAFVFAQPNAAGTWAPYLIGSTVGDKVNPYDYSMTAGSPQNMHGCLYSPINYWLVRDEHYIPELIMTSSETHFLKAEAYLRGIGVTQSTANANSEYQAGITASVNFWYSIAKNTNTTESPWNTVQPLTFTPAQLTALLAHPKVAFTASASDNLKKIYAQEWLDSFRQPWLAFNLWRRTGLTPVDPNSTPGTAYTTLYRLPYPQDEAVNNTDNYNAQLATMGGVNSTSVKVWWMK
ncbi:MAG: SusD/RagB family nutrient-binding outer membrane lipoprotein [Bacteroidota bacterium]|nr:SusD/RagB family nutrient-binding outer membrane lipoprotein [Bacteroidota bacterium]